ncbi:MAG: hypothetical protein PVH88_23225 [Ignavibacteria bacterium]
MAKSQNQFDLCILPNKSTFTSIVNCADSPFDKSPTFHISLEVS